MSNTTGWQLHKNDDGHPFYWNEHTDEVSWELPQVLAHLQPGWEMKVTNEGHIYFWDEHNQEAKWEAPLLEMSDADLPPNWELRTDNGQKYYWNSITGESRWDKPTSDHAVSGDHHDKSNSVPEGHHSLVPVHDDAHRPTLPPQHSDDHHFTPHAPATPHAPEEEKKTNDHHEEKKADGHHEEKKVDGDKQHHEEKKVDGDKQHHEEKKADDHHEDKQHHEEKKTDDHHEEKKVDDHHEDKQHHEEKNVDDHHEDKQHHEEKKADDNHAKDSSVHAPSVVVLATDSHNADPHAKPALKSLGKGEVIYSRPLYVEIEDDEEEDSFVASAIDTVANIINPDSVVKSLDEIGEPTANEKFRQRRKLLLQEQLDRAQKQIYALKLKIKEEGETPERTKELKQLEKREEILAHRIHDIVVESSHDHKEQGLFVAMAPERESELEHAETRMQLLTSQLERVQREKCKLRGHLGLHNGTKSNDPGLVALRERESLLLDKICDLKRDMERTPSKSVFTSLSETVSGIASAISVTASYAAGGVLDMLTIIPDAGFMAHSNSKLVFGFEEPGEPGEGSHIILTKLHDQYDSRIVFSYRDDRIVHYKTNLYVQPEDPQNPKFSRLILSRNYTATFGYQGSEFILGGTTLAIQPLGGEGAVGCPVILGPSDLENDLFCFYLEEYEERPEGEGADHHAPPDHGKQDHHAPPDHGKQDHHTPPDHDKQDHHAPPDHGKQDHHAPTQPNHSNQGHEPQPDHSKPTHRPAGH